MPTSSFFKVCGKHYGKTRLESFENPRPATCVDAEDDGLYRDTEAAGYGEESDDENYTEPSEWEIGIRRITNAQDRDIDDLSLSDIVLDPDGNVAFYWMGVVTLSFVYNLVVVVLRLAFKELRQQAMQDSVFYGLDLFSDVIYVLDIFVNMRISYYEDGCLVLEPAKIIANYTSQRRFVVSLLAAAPLGTAYNCLAGACRLLYLDVSAGNMHEVLVRIPRLLKFSTLSKFFDCTDSRTRYPNLVRAIKLSMNLWLVIHWIGCIYYMLSEYEGLGTTGWVYPNGTEYNMFTKKYIRVMYWSLMTLTTIGERPAPETDVEFVFTGMTFLIGVFVFAAVVGNVGDVISNMNASRQDFQTRIDQIKFYLQHRDVPDALQNRVKRWANYTWNRTQAIDEPTLLQMLPDRLRTEIAINVHLKTLRKVKLFEECEEGLLRELVLKLRPQVYSPGDYICRIGEIGKEMFIVNHGKVEILVLNAVTRRRTVVATLNPGQYFGEISLLKLGDSHNRRTADVRAIGYSELLRLSRKDLISALAEYPNAKRLLEAQARERIARTQEVRRQSVDNLSEHVDTEQRSSKNDMLLKVIRSENFQKLLTNRADTEMNQMRSVLAELKTFDSQNTKQKVQNLSDETEKLKQQLSEKHTQYKRLRRKYLKLKYRETQRTRAQQNGLHDNSPDNASNAAQVNSIKAETSEQNNKLDTNCRCRTSRVTQSVLVGRTNKRSRNSSPISLKDSQLYTTCTTTDDNDINVGTLAHSVSDAGTCRTLTPPHESVRESAENGQPALPRSQSGFSVGSIPVINISESADEHKESEIPEAVNPMGVINDWLRLDNEPEYQYLSDFSGASCSTDSSDDQFDIDMDFLPAINTDI